ncbi:hypothetical protein JXO52_06890 [bacterium]|nr:hypothetical protein [bacterium]
MKKCAIILTVLLLAAGLVYAQGDEKALTHADGMKMGFGISFGKEPMLEMSSVGGPYSLLDFPTFYLPIQLNSMIRIEPELAYYMIKMDDSGEIMTYSVLGFGAGLLYTKWYGSCNIYMGGRFLMYKWTEKYEDGTSYSHDKTDMWISPVIGAEGFACKHLSFGGELQFNYVNVGNWEGENHNDETKTSIMKFKGLLFIRWYL